MAKAFSAILMAAIPLLALAASPKPIPLQPNFDLTRYTGKWYEIYRTKNMVFESGTDNEANYAANEDGTVAVLNREWIPGTQQWNEATAVATVVGNAQLAVKFGPKQPPGDYRVLATDYSQYSIVYSEAVVFGVVVAQYGWILARQPSLPQRVIDEAFDIFEKRTGLTKNLFHETEHGVAPKPDPPLQPNFDLERYTGKWYEIYRIPMPFEQASATDQEANYAANADGTVAVLNREWLADKNQWSEANAVATVIGNAHLAVQFFPGQPAGDYRVLETDYETYTIIFSKSTSGGGKQLGWILARQESLSDDILDRAFGLFEKYTDLTKADFFKTIRGVAPKAQTRRAANDDIPLQPDFDLSKYAGQWYEIYRTKNMVFESGTDNQALYEANADGTVAVTNKEWLPAKQEWNVAHAVATVVGNAHLSVKFGPLQPPGDYRVLFTDYNKVAAVYSEFKVGPIKVKYGWMLSRTPVLEQASIDTAFSVFNERVNMGEDLFHKTEQGVAPSQ